MAPLSLDGCDDRRWKGKQTRKQYTEYNIDHCLSRYILRTMHDTETVTVTMTAAQTKNIDQCKQISNTRKCA